MPRTKLKKVATKRNRNSAADELRVNAIAEIDRELEARLSDFNFKQEQKWGQIRNHIKNIKARLSPEILAMTIGEMQDLLKQGIKTYEQAEEITSKNSAPLKNITNKTLNSYIHMSAKASKTDDGYITGDSVQSDKSGRQLGPFQSAKAKPRRRSQSVSSVLQQYNKTAPRSQQIMNRNPSRESRSRYRTPTTNRIQTMSADRGGMGPVTPKVQMGQAMAMLRYARQGETVISLGGSPVVASSMVGNRANLNIPIADGIISIQPSLDGVVDPLLVSQIDKNTLQQLRQLQDNLDVIMQFANNIQF